MYPLLIKAVEGRSCSSNEYQKPIEQYEWLRQTQPATIVLLNNTIQHNPAVLDTLGTILVEQGDAPARRQVAAESSCEGAGALTIRYHLAQGWLKAGQKSKARHELEGLLSGDAKFPEQREAQNLLKELRR